MQLTTDGILVLILGICSYGFSGPIARASWQINLRTGSETSEQTFLKIYEAAGIIFIFCAVLMFFGVLPLK
ncbi:MAG: hypothetical protein C4520_04480 [Candidatus Abyssobacteria bacterium SURF_5]|jgi:TRAP-type C4-dicarboxylate transport system permease small subunit|uniref:Uncharacterized protein n=1 Tax=Abyssobacteria bacterium (strain SURF_5) TaxID=2093360 RepID=A0A3A4P8F5_ABYX5|nr:MAG: hypothetical protein C4520_04480 [Candidatus Abyssubacteria bacterium SURF_5]